MQHVFNVRHPETWNWTPSLNSVLVGRQIRLSATASDAGSDDLDFDWSYGDASFAQETYYNNGIWPDPYPSVDGLFPFAVTDVRNHAYPIAGTYQLALKVTDDDGGAVELVLVLEIG